MLRAGAKEREIWTLSQTTSTLPSAFGLVDAAGFKGTSQAILTTNYALLLPRVICQYFNIKSQGFVFSTEYYRLITLCVAR